MAKGVHTALVLSVWGNRKHGGTQNAVTPALREICMHFCVVNKMQLKLFKVVSSLNMKTSLHILLLFELIQAQLINYPRWWSTNSNTETEALKDISSTRNRDWGLKKEGQITFYDVLQTHFHRGLSFIAQIITELGCIHG